MKIKIKINNPEEETETYTKLDLQVRKTLDGNICIFDHEYIDIIIMPDKLKVLTLAKEIVDDKVYDTQDSLFKYLQRKGVIEFDSVKSGNIYGSIEGKIANSEEVNPVDMTLLIIGRWIEGERPYMVYKKAAEDKEEKRLLDPSAEDSTELGQFKHATEKNDLPALVRPSSAQIPYGIGENKEK